MRPNRGRQFVRPSGARAACRYIFWRPVTVRQRCPERRGHDRRPRSPSTPPASPTRLTLGPHEIAPEVFPTALASDIDVSAPRATRCPPRAPRATARSTAAQQTRGGAGADRQAHGLFAIRGGAGADQQAHGLVAISRWRWRGSAGTRSRCDSRCPPRAPRPLKQTRGGAGADQQAHGLVAIRGGSGAVRTPWLAAASPQRSGASSARRQTSARLEEARRYWHGFRRCRCDLTECLACRVKTHAFLEVPGVVALD